MTYKPSILNISSGVFLAGILIYTFINYSKLSEAEGWGVVGMVGLFGCGILLLAIDLVLQLFLKNRKLINIIGAIAVITMTLLFLSG